MEVVTIAQVPETGQTFKGEDPSDVLELEPDETVLSVGAMCYDLMVRPVMGRELLVRGRVSCTVEFRCSRCAEPFTLNVSDSDYMRSYELLDDTESVDLTPDMREATLLAFPAYPVCKPDCLGLCPTCGKELNTGVCACVPEEDARWGGLDKLEI